MPPTNQHTVPGRVAIGGTSAFAGVAMAYDLYVDNIKLHARPKYALNGTIDNTITDIFINENTDFNLGTVQYTPTSYTGDYKTENHKPILTNMSNDMDYVYLIKKLPKYIIPAYDGLSLLI